MTQPWIQQSPIQLLLPALWLNEWNSAPTNGDYERACANSDDWIQPVSIKGGFGFVLGGGDPTATTLDEHNGELRIIRWIYGESDMGMLEFARNASVNETRDGEFTFENPVSDWCIIDAARRPDDPLAPCISFHIKAGGVSVITEYLESAKYCAVVHQIT